MMIIYIFGNGNISFSDFLTYYKNPLDQFLVNPENQFIVCEFRGTDTLTLELLKCTSSNVTVYHIGEHPRYRPDAYHTKVSQWIFKGHFTSDEERDHAAIESCTHFLAVDFNSNDKRTSGTQKNILNCLKKGKIDLLTLDIT